MEKAQQARSTRTRNDRMEDPKNEEEKNEYTHSLIWEETKMVHAKWDLDNLWID